MLVIFDLDGTLIDSAEDLVIATNETRAHFGLPPLDSKLVHSYVGNGAAVLVRRALGPDTTDEQAEDALLFFVKFYRKHALEHTRLYPGIANAVNALADHGNLLAVLTNKPVKISTDILAGLGIGDKFKRVYGGDSFPDRKKPDPIGILTLMAETKSRPAETWMVGDSSVDVETARNAHVKVCGVTWGIRPETLAAHPPDAFAHNPAELPRLLETGSGH